MADPSLHNNNIAELREAKLDVQQRVVQVHGAIRELAGRAPGSFFMVVS